MFFPKSSKFPTRISKIEKIKLWFSLKLPFDAKLNVLFTDDKILID